MKYFIDTADISQIKKWIKILGKSCAGITTNTAMLKDMDAIVEFLADLRVEVPTDLPIMVQVWKGDDLSRLPLNDNIVIKSSAIEENFEMWGKNKRRKAATTCYDIIQINQAIEFGLEFTMVYYAKNAYKGLLEDAVKLKERMGSSIGLVAASIHTPAEVYDAINAGCDYATIRPDCLEMLFNNKQAIGDTEGVKAKEILRNTSK